VQEWSAPNAPRNGFFAFARRRSRAVPWFCFVLVFDSRDRFAPRTKDEKCTSAAQTHRHSDLKIQADSAWSGVISRRADRRMRAADVRMAETSRSRQGRQARQEELATLSQSSLASLALLARKQFGFFHAAGRPLPCMGFWPENSGVLGRLKGSPAIARNRGIAFREGPLLPRHRRSNALQKLRGSFSPLTWTAASTSPERLASFVIPNAPTI